MLLAVDVGNTPVPLALFDGDRLAADWRVTSRREWTADEVAVELRDLFELRDFELSAVTGVVIASVVPTINPALVEASRRYLKCEPVMVGPGVETSVRIRYENPRDVGADRIANALAAHTKYGGPVVVIDFGTAVTYDAINAEGDYLGGAIAPGVEISLDALVSHTAMLRRVEPVAPESVIGRNTVTSIQSGLVWGFVAQVEGMVARMVRELGGSARVIATGGQALRVALQNSVLKLDVRQLEEQARRQHRQFEELNRIGIALSAERDIDKLQEFILTTMRQLTNADGASLWLKTVDDDVPKLFLASSQNFSIDNTYQAFKVPVDEKSVVGYTVTMGTSQIYDDAYNPPPGKPQGGRGFDAQYGYRTKSMLTVPMRNLD